VPHESIKLRYGRRKEDQVKRGLSSKESYGAQKGKGDIIVGKVNNVREIYLTLGKGVL